MGENKPLLRLTILYTVGNLATRVINFGLVFVTTFYLSREQVGDYDLFLISLSLLAPIASLQLAEAALRWLLDPAHDHQDGRLVSTLLGILVLSFCGLGAGMAVWHTFSPIPFGPWLFALVVFQSIYVVFQQILRGLGQNQIFVVSSILYSFLYAVGAILSLVLTSWSIKGLIAANLLGSVLTCLYLALWGKIPTKPRLGGLSLSLGKELLAYSIPLIPNTLSWWAISSANRYFILASLGKAANGIFAISQKIPTLLLLFTGIFYQAWQEKSLQTQNQPDSGKYHKEVLEVYIRILFILTLGILVTARLSLEVLVSPAFREAWLYTPLLLLGVVFNSLSSFLGTGYLSRKDTRGAMVSSLAGGGLTIAASAWLIPRYGLQGAAFAIFLGYGLVFLIRQRDAASHYGFQFPVRVFFGHFLLFVLSCALAWQGTLLFDLLNLLVALIGLLLLDGRWLQSLWKNRPAARNPPLKPAEFL